MLLKNLLKLVGTPCPWKNSTTRTNDFESIFSPRFFCCPSPDAFDTFTWWESSNIITQQHNIMIKSRLNIDFSLVAIQRLMDIWRTNYTYLYPRPHNNEKQFKCQLRNPVFILENCFNFKNFLRRCEAKKNCILQFSWLMMTKNPKNTKFKRKIGVYV